MSFPLERKTLSPTIHRTVTSTPTLFVSSVSQTLAPSQVCISNADCPAVPKLISVHICRRINGRAGFMYCVCNPQFSFTGDSCDEASTLTYVSQVVFGILFAISVSCLINLVRCAFIAWLENRKFRVVAVQSSTDLPQRKLAKSSLVNSAQVFMVVKCCAILLCITTSTQLAFKFSVLVMFARAPNTLDVLYQMLFGVSCFLSTTIGIILLTDWMKFMSRRHVAGRNLYGPYRFLSKVVIWLVIICVPALAIGGTIAASIVSLFCSLVAWSVMGFFGPTVAKLMMKHGIARGSRVSPVGLDTSQGANARHEYHITIAKEINKTYRIARVALFALGIGPLVGGQLDVLSIQSSIAVFGVLLANIGQTALVWAYHQHITKRCVRLYREHSSMRTLQQHDKMSNSSWSNPYESETALSGSLTYSSQSRILSGPVGDSMPRKSLLVSGRTRLEWSVVRPDTSGELASDADTNTEECTDGSVALSRTDDAGDGIRKKRSGMFVHLDACDAPTRSVGEAKRKVKKRKDSLSTS